MNRLESKAEKALREAIEAGEFDDLPGKGQPLDLRENPFEDPDLRTVHRLLRNAGFAPAWIMERKDIDAAIDGARVKLSRAWELYGKASDGTHPDWKRNVSEFLELSSELNERIRLYNLKAPATGFHRSLIDAARLVREVQAREEAEGEGK